MIKTVPGNSEKPGLSVSVPQHRCREKHPDPAKVAFDYTIII
jgi:hypothetical protein